MSFASIDGRQLEYRMIPGDLAQPTLVFLHEGLGSRRRCGAIFPTRSPPGSGRGR